MLFRTRVISINTLTAKDELSHPGHFTFYSPRPQGEYLGGSQPMLPCVSLFPPITKVQN